jgi:hypothetical protein
MRGLQPAGRYIRLLSSQMKAYLLRPDLVFKACQNKKKQHPFYRVLLCKLVVGENLLAAVPAKGTHLITRNADCADHGLKLLVLKRSYAHALTDMFDHGMIPVG